VALNATPNRLVDMLPNQLGLIRVQLLSLESHLQARMKSYGEKKKPMQMLRNYPNFLVITMFAMEGGLKHGKWYMNTFKNLGMILFCVASNLLM